MNADSNLSLVAAYRATAYWVETPSGSLCVRVEGRHHELDAVLRSAGVAEWAIVTAWNPRSRRLADEENRARQERLIAEIRALGFACWPVQNVADGGEWPAEASVLVLGIGRDAAMELARRYEQHAIVVGRVGEAAELVWIS